MLSKIYQNRGLILTGVTSIATLWLAATSQLGLYIHPRYNTFTIALSVLGLVFTVFSITHKIPRVVPSLKNHILGILLITIALVCLIVVPPTTLSSSIASQRGVNSASTTESIAKLTQHNTYSPFGGQTLDLSIKDWSNLLAQTNDPAFFSGKMTTVEGFITQDESGNSSIFYVSRFVVNCCAVDARPVGVPVYVANWNQQFKQDQWVAVSGTFDTKDGRIVLIPDSVNEIEKPKDPYVY